ncbi:ATP-binding cassette domain-containing protein [Pseudonocardia xinjiangensis]|uniref:ATP-binding cassette domain-containing protein n=1 Tax=Pseudonocardia xinjiangensis TaxID=75289 RepID=UPI003D916E55
MIAKGPPTRRSEGLHTVGDTGIEPVTSSAGTQPGRSCASESGVALAWSAAAGVAAHPGSSHACPPQSSSTVTGRLRLSRRLFPSALSGGQRQRVALARALAGDPAVLLADEVTAALDDDTTAHVLDLLDKVRATGTGVLLVTHEPAVAARADRVLTLADEALKG